jgi:hypothetical protein
MTATIMLAALLRVDLPNHSAFFVDGGTLQVGGDLYLPRDSVLGVPESFEALSEGVGDEAPAGAITFIPPDGVSSSSLNSPNNAGSRVRIWLAEVDQETGAVIGSPDPMADWIVDYPEMSNGKQGRRLTLNCVTTSEAMFERNLGNSLSPAFHKRMYPGETGLDNASGVATSVAWGAASAPRGTSSVGSSSSNVGGGGRINERLAQD